MHRPTERSSHRIDFSRVRARARCGRFAQIKATMGKFTETLAMKQKEADEFGAKHRITAQKPGGAPATPAGGDGDGGGSQGVLI